MEPLRDFRGNEINVGDHIVYAPISSTSLVEAEVVEIKLVDGWNRKVPAVFAKPLRWSGDSWGWRQGRQVRLTNIHLLMKVDVSE